MPEGVAKRDLHRMGGATIENLRLKPREAGLAIPGISVLRCASAREAAEQIRTVLPTAKRLVASATTVASSAEDLIRSAGFAVVPMPSKTLPNHCRIIHPDGALGFTDENLARLALVFVNTEEGSS